MSVERIPRLRLAQIAERRLKALGIEGHADSETAECRGLFRFRNGVVLDPLTKVKVAEAPFHTVAHDQLEFLQPPLAGLGPLPFYDASSTGVIEERVAQLLTERMQRLQEATRRLQAIRIEPSFDLNRLCMVTLIDTPARQYELIADGKSFRIARLRTPRGEFIDVARGVGELQLEDFRTRSDIELHLTSQGHTLEASAVDAQTSATRDVLESIPPTAESLSVELLQRFGPGASIRVGQGGLQISRDFRFHDVHYRFEATHERGTSFKGRFGASSGDKWSDRFDLTRFPGIEPLVRIVLGLPEKAASSAPAPTTAPPVEAPPSSAIANEPPRLGLPVAGEVWVMNVLVEQESGNEIRYVCTDVDGQPYGAQRVLPKDDFPRIFSPHGNGWRLKVQIAGLRANAVLYSQLGADGQTRGAQKTIPLEIFTSTFVPEAAAY